ncbi:MBL fold metallo-hydrolase [Desulfococcaceae bacterium HSG8]|nr:MBL fold metallo-hydrolase [Desulfococcaceae bacterium HSG8]
MSGQLSVVSCQRTVATDSGQLELVSCPVGNGQLQQTTDNRQQTTRISQLSVASGQLQRATDNGQQTNVCMLASGSKGNAVFISGGSTAILVDAGLSGIEIERRLKSRGISPRELDAIVVSHEHADHTRGVGVLSRRFCLPVCISRKTKRVAGSRLGTIRDARVFTVGTGFTIGSLTIRPFSISHDAEDAAGFTVAHNGVKIGIATDLGIATSVVKAHLKDCTVLIIEANHDPEMLIRGPYPWPLKQRVRSRIGHLSNNESRELLEEVRHDGLSHVILAHLSEANNTPEKALNAVSQAMNHCNARLMVANQYVCGDLLHLR